MRFALMAPITLPLLLTASQGLAQRQEARPVLAFPEAGVDDPAAYQGYTTRFFRDASGNVVQIYLDARSGRVVNLFADALDESVGFTVRDPSGKPVALSWASLGAIVSASGPRRTIEYQVRAAASAVDIGLLVLNSMRVERDLGYSGRQTAPYEVPALRLPEEEQLVANIERLPASEQAVQLRMLNARDPSDLRSRLVPRIEAISDRGAMVGMRASQLSLDGKTTLKLEIAFDPGEATAAIGPVSFSLRSKSAQPITFTVRASADGAALTPLFRGQIFNEAFATFVETERQRVEKLPRSGRLTAKDSAAISRYRQLERDVAGTELLSSREKLMAGLPNYATYFGRDMMMTALMMEPVWQPSMSENAIAAALAKLGPKGDVSHEEALGGQAIRENSAEYNAHIAEYFRLVQRGDTGAPDTALSNARALLVNLQRVRENYHMRDDEFQLPILVARYLANPSVSASRKRAFLLDSSNGGGPRVRLLMSELGLVASLAAPYARNPVVRNLVGSPRQDSTQFRSISWRDSNAGYGNGRYAMDINAIWVPKALEATSEILASLRALRRPSDPVWLSPLKVQEDLAEFISKPELLQRGIQNWRGAVEHFVVKLTRAEVRGGVREKLESLPPAENTYWEKVLGTTPTIDARLDFVALSLDENGSPVRVVNTDPATWIFLLDGAASSRGLRERVLRDVRTFVTEFPVGLFVDRLGPLVANDAYASPSVQRAFEKDQYHSPRVVWGREVNLIMLGLSKQILGATNSAGQPRSPDLQSYVSELRSALEQINSAVDASGLKHNELWSYEIANGKLTPIRYGASTDVQLWNVTDLAVQYTLSRLKRP